MAQSYQACKFLGLQHNLDDTYNLYFRMGRSEVYYQLASFEQMEDILHLTDVDCSDLSKGEILTRFISYITNNDVAVADFLGLSEVPTSWKSPLKDMAFYEQATANAQSILLTKDHRLNQHILLIILLVKRAAKDLQMSLSESLKDQTLTITINNKNEQTAQVVIDYQNFRASHVFGYVTNPIASNVMVLVDEVINHFVTNNIQLKSYYDNQKQLQFA